LNALYLIQYYIIMVLKCRVPNYKGNYTKDNKVHIFKFPKDEVMRLKWMRAIPRHDFNITNYSAVSIIIIGIIILYYYLAWFIYSNLNGYGWFNLYVSLYASLFIYIVNMFQICHKHLKISDIIWEISAVDEKTGRTLTAPLSKPRLDVNAVPCILPDCPSYLSTCARP
jgi:hypothetical protein